MTLPVYIHRRQIHTISDPLAQQLLALTLPTDSGMADALDGYRTWPAEATSDRALCWIARAAGEPVGWAMAFDEHSGAPARAVHVYVHISHRRAGLGSRLVRLAAAHAASLSHECRVMAHCPTSLAFYRTLQRPLNLEIERWDDAAQAQRLSCR